MRSRRWDIFCRVIDNFGDIGLAWRLSADLAARGQTVRLWADDASALAWMAPHGAAGVSLHAWSSAAAGEPGDIVIEAFGCDPPPAFVRRMAGRDLPPVWINLEYLSAEAYVARNHGLASPQSTGPGAGLGKWFFYPGFIGTTGGLVREVDLVKRQRRFEPSAWLRSRGLAVDPAEQVVSLFGYEQPALAALVERWAQRPTLLLACAGETAAQVDALLGPTLRRGALRALALPRLDQVDYDHLLWSADLNLVRGEDSFVRAQWAARPFVWQIYRQADAAHEVKLQAFLDLFLASADASLGAEIGALWHACNGMRSVAAIATGWPEPVAWRRHVAAWRNRLVAQPDLASRLIDFAAARG